MSYSAHTRDQFRLAVAAVTGASVVAALAATGWVAGAAAHDSRAVQQDAATAQAHYRHQLAAWRKARADGARTAPDREREDQVVLRARPERTDVTWRYVQGTGTSAPVGTGGQVVAVPAASGGQQGSAPPPAPPAPAAHAPAPAPAPAPSTGS